jgi:TPR repeat protein
VALVVLVVGCFIALLARPRLAENYFAEGKALQKDNNPAANTSALEAFRKAAWLGNAEAMEEVGLAYKDGLGAAQNYETAYQWFQRAAEHGSAHGMFSVAVTYMTGKGVAPDQAKVAEWTRKSAEGGYARAEANLGTFYLQGSYTFPVDHVKAMEWMKKAAEAGEVRAMHDLGIAYLSGDGVEKSPETSLRWFRQAADQGDKESAVNASDLYMRGIGTPEDRQQGMVYMEKAADLGDPKAMITVGKAAWKANDTPKALKYFEKCAGTGNADAMVSTAALYAGFETQDQLSGAQRLEKSKFFLSSAMQKEGEISPEIREFVPRVLAWQAELSQKISAPSAAAEDSTPATAEAEDSKIINCYDSPLSQRVGHDSSASTRMQYASLAGSMAESLNGADRVSVTAMGDDRRFLVFLATPQNESALRNTAAVILSNPSIRGRICTERFAEAVFAVFIDESHQRVIKKYKTRPSDMFDAYKSRKK